jgi:hypothetical protein
VLYGILTDLGYTPDAILAGWRERGWLEIDNDRLRYTTKKHAKNDERDKSVKRRMVVIKRFAIEEVGGTAVETTASSGDGWDVVGTYVGTC